MENELISQLKTEVTTYGESLGNAGKLRLINLVSRILGLFLLIFTLMLCVLALFTFGAVAAIDAMAVYMPVWAAALIISSLYVLLIVIAVACRKPLFINPFIKQMSKHLIQNQEQLDIEILKAEHEVQLQTVRFENRVENATRELNLYASIVNSIWEWIVGKLKK
jgi:hypothetical protein